MSPAERHARLVAREASHEAARTEPERRHDEPTAPVEPDLHEPGRRHLHLVQANQRRRAHRRRAIVPMALGIILTVSMGLVALHAMIAEAQFRLDNLQQQASVQQSNYEKLRLAVAELESPSRIVSVAEGRLGMQQPGSVTYLPAPSLKLAGSSPGSGSSAVGGTLAGYGTGSSVLSATSAPQGDANWPTIKPYLSANP